MSGNGRVLAIAVLAAASAASAGAVLAVRALRAPQPPDRVSVAIDAPGYPADEVERLVTGPLEAALDALPGIEGMESVSAPDRAQVILSLSSGQDRAAAVVRIRERVRALAPRLPAEAAPAAVVPLRERVPIRWALSSATLSAPELAALEARAADAVSGVPGVAAVASCGPTPEWLVTVDPDRAGARGLVPAEVQAALEARGPPGARSGAVQAEAWTPEDLRAAVVHPPRGAEVPLAEVARLERTVAPGGCRARGPQGELVVGTADVDAADAARVVPEIEARLRAVPLPAGASLAMLGRSPRLGVRVRPGDREAPECVARIAAAIARPGGWALQVEGDGAWLSVDAATARDAPALGARFARALAGCPGAAYAGFEEPPPGVRVERVRVAGPELDELERIAEALRAAIAAEPRAHVLGRGRSAPSIDATVEPERAAALGISPREAGQAILLAIAGVTVGRVREGDGTVPVRLRWGDGADDLPRALDAATVRRAGGAAVHLGEIVQLRTGVGREIRHDGRRRVVELRVEVERGAEASVRDLVLRSATTAPLPAGTLVYLVDAPRGGLEALREWLSAR